MKELPPPDTVQMAAASFARVRASFGADCRGSSRGMTVTGSRLLSNFDGQATLVMG